MTCIHHVTPQAWCGSCPLVGAAPLPLPPLIIPDSTARHDASAARIAGLEGNVNAQRERIAELEQALRGALAAHDDKQHTWPAEQEQRRKWKGLVGL